MRLYAHVLESRRPDMARQIGQVLRGELEAGVGVGEVLIEHRGEQPLLALEVDIDQVLVAFGALRYAVHTCTGHAVLGELPESGFEDARLGLLCCHWPMVTLD